DLLQAEATAEMIDAGSPAQARRALQQLDRGLSQRLEQLRAELIELEALIAYEIDFPEEDEGPVAPERVERAWGAARERSRSSSPRPRRGSGCAKGRCWSSPGVPTPANRLCSTPCSAGSAPS